MLFKQINYKAILFDFDGVIANTMHDNFDAWHYAFSTFGITFEKSEYFALEGLKPSAVAQHFLALNQLESLDNINYVVAQKESYYIENMNFSLYPDVINLLEFLKENNIKTAVVTGASKLRFTKSIDTLPSGSLLSLFDEIVTASDYENGKPNPEPYLVAMDKFTLSSHECLVVENAPLGISSAKKANMKTVALCTTLDKSFLREADYIYQSMTEFYNKISGIS